MKSVSAFILILLFAGNASSQYSLQIPFPNLPAFSSPLEMQTANDGTNRIFIVQQKGKIYFFQNDPAVSTRKLFFDFSGTVSQDGGELGLLGLAFHPNFKTNGYFYVNYTTTAGGQYKSFISRFQVSPSNPDTVLTNTEQILLTLDQPYANHNGGHLAFGNDGYLYASFGDGGSGGDPLKNGQNRSVWLGKILRLDVDHESGGNHYDIPPTNPFATGTQGFKKEIYAYGLRNTWKFSFDRTTGTLWAGDVGQNIYEEVDTIINGGNYGWNIMEGFHRYNNSKGDTTQMILPLVEYSHSLGVSITGGFLYRGSAIPSLVGKYIYGDYGSARIWALTTGVKPVVNQEIIPSGHISGLSISSFGEDQDKNIYILGYGNGRIYKLTSTEPSDNLPPIFEYGMGLPGEIFIKVHDDRLTDAGLKNISVSPLGVFDTTKYFINLGPILRCSGDKSVHTVGIISYDNSMHDCFTLIFEDCAGNRSFDTVCFGKMAVDTIAPKFTLHDDLGDPFHRYLRIQDEYSLKSINWSLVGGGKDTNSFSVIYSPQILWCPTDTLSHTVTFQQLDSTIGGCMAFVFYDCTGNSSRDTICFQSHATKFVNLINSSVLSLQCNHPNPFLRSTAVSYSTSEFGNVTLSLHDMLGKEIAKIFDAQQAQGKYTIDFDGSKLSSGSYILRLESGGKVVSKKIVKE